MSEDKFVDRLRQSAKKKIKADPLVSSVDMHTEVAAHIDNFFDEVAKMIESIRRDPSRNHTYH